jgi:hypothetical protein
MESKFQHYVDLGKKQVQNYKTVFLIIKQDIKEYI